MSEQALPCVICGSDLENVDSTATNQPYKGTTFHTNGHYGSTYFDPMDGSYIELNICDVCLAGLQKDGKILFGREYQPVMCRVKGTWFSVGRRRVQRELTTYNGVGDGESEWLRVDIRDVGTDAWDTDHFKVEWAVTREHVEELDSGVAS